MIKKFALQASVGITMAAGALGAQAATMTLANWTFGNGNRVSASTPAYSGLSGGFSGTLTGAPGLDGAINTYCVELTEQFHFGTAYSDYSVVSAGSYFSAAKAQTLGKLISYVFDGNFFGSVAANYRDDLSTALQLAIWNTVYDSDITLSSGSFKDTSVYKNGSVNFAGANALLTASQAASQDITYQLYVLKSVGRPGHQDQLLWKAVPEPASFALAALALGAAGLASRRRKTAA